MKGIILSGGLGTRLNPITKSISKQLLPIYDKPMVYYSLSLLIDLNIKEILLITNSKYIKNYKDLLKDGKQWGIKISYMIQKKPRGIADAFIIGKDFIKNQNVALILGDNIFYGIDLVKIKNIINNKDFYGSLISVYNVDKPEKYGVLEFNKNKPIKIIEKPLNTKSKFAVTGLYFYDRNVTKYVKLIKPSKRKELEITDLNNIYLKKKLLQINYLEKDSVWLDAGSFKSLLQSSQFIQTIQERQNIIIGSPDLSSLKQKNITIDKFKNNLNFMNESEYSEYLQNYLKNNF